MRSRACCAFCCPERVEGELGQAVRAQERAGVRRQRFHDMRHAFATLLLDAGEEIAVISKMLGHADHSTTVDVYSHLSTERSRVAAARIDGLLKHRQLREETAS